MVQQAVQDGIGDGGFTDDGVPVFDGALAGNDGGIFLIAVLDDFEQIVTLGIIERSQEKIVKDEELDFGQAVEGFEMRAVGLGGKQHFKQTRGTQTEHGVSPASREIAESKIFRPQSLSRPPRWPSLEPPPSKSIPSLAPRVGKDL